MLLLLMNISPVNVEPHHPIGYTILDFRFWILDWGMPHQLTVPEIGIMQVKAK
jgi:hypothetical protein